MLHHHLRHSAQALLCLLASLASLSEVSMPLLSADVVSELAGPPVNQAGDPLPSSGRVFEDSLECDFFSMVDDDANS